MDKKAQSAPESNGENEPPPEFTIESGEVLLWKPAKHGDRDVPCVSIGAFRSGLPAINFRKHLVKSPGRLRPTSDGIAISFAEFDRIVERVRLVALAMRSEKDENGGHDVAA